MYKRNEHILHYLEGNPCFEIRFPVIEAGFKVTMIGVPNYFCDRVDNVICNCNSGKVASLSIIILLLFNFVEQVNNRSILLANKLSSNQTFFYTNE